MEQVTDHPTLAVLHAARKIAAMREPSVEKILRRHGYEYEADQVWSLVSAVLAMDGKEVDNGN